jgi:hypothetical protein
VRGIIVGFVSVTLVLAACSTGSSGASPTISRTSSPTSATTSGTQIVYVRPTLPDHSLKPGYKIAKTVHGASCWQYDTTGVLRCDNFNGGGGDFCWRFVPSAPSTTSMVCLVKPWGRDVVAVSLAKGENVNTPDPGSPGRDETIALQLVNGQGCTVNYGALDSVGPWSPKAPIVTYTCDRSLYLVDHPNRSEPFWTMRSVRASRDWVYKWAGTVRIAKAYYVQIDS